MNLSRYTNKLIAGIGVVFGLVLAYVLYSMFFADIPDIVTGSDLNKIETVLPEGRTLDFSQVEAHGNTTNRFSTSQPDPATIGVQNLTELIQPK